MTGSCTEQAPPFCCWLFCFVFCFGVLGFFCCCLFVFLWHWRLTPGMLYHWATSQFLFFCFEAKLANLPRLSSNLLSSALTSQVAEITVMSHHTWQAPALMFIKYGAWKVVHSQLKKIYTGDLYYNKINFYKTTVGYRRVETSHIFHYGIQMMYLAHCPEHNRSLINIF